VTVRLQILAPLRHRDFRLLFIGQAVSVVGNQVYAVALPFQILALGGSPLQLGAGFTIFATAQLTTILFGGALVDRFPRRVVILAMDLLSAIVVAVVAVLGFTHHLQIPHLYVLSAFFGATFSFYAPALSAIMPELVPADALVPGNALRGLSSQSARVVGPLVGGLVVTAWGAPWAFAIDAASFVFAFCVFWFSQGLRREPAPRKPILSDIREGIAYTFSVTWLWVAIVGFAATNGFFFAGFTVAMPILVLKVLKGSAAIYGLINAVAGAGEVLGGVLVGNLHFKRLLLGTYLFSALLGLAFAIIGIAPVLAFVLAGGFAFNVCLVMSSTHWDSAVQQHVPPKLLGRVTSVDYFGSFLSAPVAPLVAAALVERLGPGPIFILGGVATFLYWMAALLVVRPSRQLDTTAAPQ
jgi:MFS family permease